jgi:hypothetical protein
MYVTFIIIVIIILTWVWHFQLRDLDLENVKVSDIEFKTGDLLLFRSDDNIYPIFFGNYFSHIGMVYIDTTNGEKYLFEAVNKPEFSGVRIDPLQRCLNNHKGSIFIKSLKNKIDDENVKDFSIFVDVCCKNMYYEKNIIGNALLNTLLSTPIDFNVNCGELCFISLIKLGLAPISWYKQNTKLHYLKYICYLTELQNNEYLQTCRIIV